MWLDKNNVELGCGPEHNVIGFFDGRKRRDRYVHDANFFVGDSTVDDGACYQLVVHHDHEISSVANHDLGSGDYGSGDLGSGEYGSGDHGSGDHGSGEPHRGGGQL